MREKISDKAMACPECGFMTNYMEMLYNKEERINVVDTYDDVKINQTEDNAINVNDTFKHKNIKHNYQVI